MFPISFRVISFLYFPRAFLWAINSIAPLRLGNYIFTFCASLLHINGVFSCFFCARTIFIRLLRSSGDNFFQNFFLPCTIRWTCVARSSGVASFHRDLARLRPSSERFFFSDFVTTTIFFIITFMLALRWFLCTLPSSWVRRIVSFFFFLAHSHIKILPRPCE